MTERELGLVHAVDTAKALLKEWGVRKPADINLPLFAASKGVKVIAGKLDGAVARLKFGRKPIIRVSDQPAHPGDAIFGTGHELGHLVLEHPPSRVEVITKESRLYTPPRAGHGRHYEAEANAFSAEICMPSDQLGERVSLATPSLELPHWISMTYTMPLQASTIRFAELTESRCAAVCSRTGKVEWIVPSRTFGMQLPKGARLDPGSLAGGFHHHGKLDERARSLAGSVWFGPGCPEEIVEHSVVVPGANVVVTLLWAPTPMAIKLAM